MTSSYNSLYQSQTQNRQQIANELQPQPQHTPPGLSFVGAENINPSPYRAEEKIMQILQRPQRSQPQQHQQLQQPQQTVAPIQQVQDSAGSEPPKTPLALLNEVLLKLKTTAKMEMSEDGAVNGRVFQCKLSVERNNTIWEACGKAPNKKDAKHEAARVLLLQLDDRLEGMMAYSPQGRAVVPARVEVEMDVDLDVSGNPVGELNDLCMRSRIPPPEYEDVEREAIPSQPVFTITCRLNGRTAEDGTGTTKKYAKRVSAYKVLQKLKQAIENPSLAPDLFPEAEQETLCKKLSSLNLNGSKKNSSKIELLLGKAPAASVVPPVKPPPTLSETIQSLKAISGPKWELLMVMKAVDVQKSDHTLVLNDVAEEQKLKLEYEDFAPQPDDNKHRSLVSVGLDPKLIFMGGGASAQQARKSAAFSALEYFRLSTRK